MASAWWRRRFWKVAMAGIDGGEGASTSAPVGEAIDEVITDQDRPDRPSASLAREETEEAEEKQPEAIARGGGRSRIRRSPFPPPPDSVPAASRRSAVPCHSLPAARHTRLVHLAMPATARHRPKPNSE